MLKMKYLINRMECNTLLQQVWWIDGRGVYLHFKGQRIKLHKWCVINSNKLLEYSLMHLINSGKLTKYSPM
jgi:hypothetical protein